MYLHANAKLGPAGRLALVHSIAGGLLDQGSGRLMGFRATRTRERLRSALQGQAGRRQKTAAAPIASATRLSTAITRSHSRRCRMRS